MGTPTGPRFPGTSRVVSSLPVELGDPDDRAPDEEPLAFRAPLPLEDRLWRHPSELELSAPGRSTLERRRWPAGWSVALVSGLIGSVLTFGLVAATGTLDNEPSAREVVVRERAGARSKVDSSPPVSDVVQIAEDARLAIARVEVASGGRSGSGSGVVFRDDGYLLTNAHVTEDATRITVVMAGGEELDGRLVGADAVTDIAVVKVEGDDPFLTAVLGSAVDLQVGEETIAMGSPLGLLGGSSVTTGVVSALGRRVAAEDGPPLLDMIQTDAAIAPGSSGGALLDASGAVIGITTAVAVSEAGGEGLGFATPIDIARSVADEIIREGRAIHVWLGIEGSDISGRSVRDAGYEAGALVERIVPGSPAAAAGLIERDVIVALSGDEIRSMSNLVIALRDRDPGEEVELVVLRDGRRSAVSLTLGERPPGT